MAPTATAERTHRAEFAVGQRLEAHYQGKTYTAEVRLSPDTDKPEFWITDGGPAAIRKAGYSSPSGMGRAVTGRSSCDGYTFWKVIEEGKAQAKTGRKPKGKAKAAKTAASKPRAKRATAA